MYKVLHGRFHVSWVPSQFGCDPLISVTLFIPQYNEKEVQ